MRNIISVVLLLFIISCSSSLTKKENLLQMIDNNYNLLFDSNLDQEVQIKDAKKLIELINLYIKKYPKDINVVKFLQRAQANVIALDYKKALIDYDSALNLAISQEKIIIYYYKGAVYSKLDENSKALNSYQTALDIYNDNKLTDENTLKILKLSIAGVYSSMGLHNKSFEIYKQLYDINQSDEFLFKIVDALFYDANYKQQLYYLNIVLKKYPNNANFYTIRGNTYMFLNDYNKAITDYNKAISIDNRKLDTFINRSFAYIKIKNYSAAIKDTNYVLEKDNLYVGAYINQIDALIKQSKYKEAISIGLKAIETEYKNSNDVLYDNLIQAYLYNKDLKNAIVILDMRIKEGYDLIYKDNLKEVNIALKTIKSTNNKELEDFNTLLKSLIIIN